jgi:hypothetical protein
LVWNELREGVKADRLPRATQNFLENEFSDTALSVVTRFGLMRTAVKDLNSALRELYSSLPETIPLLPNQSYGIVRDEEIEAARDMVLVRTDSVFFEFRSYLELVAIFVYGILKGLKKEPASEQRLSSGQTVQLATAKGGLSTHNFLMYLCDQAGTSDNRPPVSADWFKFLSSVRNLFTHRGAPYCAIEQKSKTGPSFDVLIMKKNILDFQTATSTDYFRISEFQVVVGGATNLCSFAESYLKRKIAEMGG